MKIAILGLGVIGTTYAYAFQKAGHQVEHVLRDSKKNTAPKELSVDLLDGRYHSKGESKHDTYEVRVAEANSEYDFIFLSVRHGFVKEAVETLRKNNIKGTLVFFCNFWDTRKEVQEWAGDYDYIMAFPTAGGHMQEDHLDGVLFDHLMLEGEQKAHISNYADLTALLTSADLKWEVPMIQLIVNAFVEKEKTGAVVEVLYASSDHEKVKAKYEELTAQYPENYLAIYDVPLDTDLNTLDHYPSVWIGKEEFE